MIKEYKAINPNGEIVRATFQEAKESGYTILLTSLNELEEDEDFDLEDGTVLSISFQSEEELPEGDDEIFFYGDNPVLPDDPEEGEEGYDDKAFY